MTKAPPLLIGLGNRLRSDDGAGLWLAAAIAAQGSGMDVLRCHQLTPELAEPISQARAVLFADAWIASDNGSRQPQLQPIRASTCLAAGGHVLTPAGLLALCAVLYGPSPPAWQLLIPGEQWQVGDQLSPRTLAACHAAVPLVRAWAARHA